MLSGKPAPGLLDRFLDEKNLPLDLEATDKSCALF